MLRLKNPYVSVEYSNGGSFGGNQRLSDNNTVRQVGCGVIASADLLIYISRYHAGARFEFFPELNKKNPLSPDTYYNFVEKLRRFYFPLIPFHGMNGLGLMAGMQLFFKRHALPYSCHWCIKDKGIWEKVSEMLASDIPVIMSVGPNFPFIWKNGRATLYKKNENGELVPASLVKAHFITITGIDENWLEISSWGQCFYLNRRMYEEYVSKYSAPLVSNILYIRRK